MAIDPSDKSLVDPTGHPISPPQQHGHIDASTEALIKSELNSAVDHLREWNRRDLAEIKQDVAKKWRWLTILLGSLNIVLGISLVTVIEWAPRYTRQQLLEPKVDATIDRIITNKSKDYVDNKLKPLNNRVSQTNDQLTKTAKEVREKQTVLEKQEQTISSQVEVQRLATAVRTGDRKAWEQIQAKAQGDSNEAKAAQSAQADVEAFYDIDRAQLSFLIRVDPISLEDPGYSVDELITQLDVPGSKDRQAVINSISQKAGPQSVEGKRVVQILCERVENEPDLRVVARITRAISLITKKDIRPLDVKTLSSWWNDHKKDTEYQSPYRDLIDVTNHWEDPSVDVLPTLNRVIEHAPESLFARALKTEKLIEASDGDAADVELKEIEKRQSDYRWALYFRAVLFSMRHDTDHAISSLNQLLQRSPVMENRVRDVPALAGLLADPRIKLPGKQGPN